MLRVVTPLLRQMLHLKLLTINIVTGVTGFQSMLHLSHLECPHGSRVAQAGMEDGGQRSKVKGPRRLSGPARG